MSDLETEVATDTGTGAEPVASSGDAPTAEPAAESLRDTIGKAFDEATQETKGESGQAPGRSRDDSGRFAIKPKAPKAEGIKPAPQSSSTTSLATPKSPQGAAPVPEKPQVPATKPPASWKPLAREKWGSLPPEVQAEVQRVDGEVRHVMERAAVAQQENDAFRRAWQPYESMIRAEGADPAQAAANLFQTAAALRTLPPWQKHQLMAQILTQHGADLEMLSQALAGQQPTQEQQARMPQAGYQDPRVDQLLQRLEAAERQSQERGLQRTSQSIQEWAKDKEFFEDLRDTMADMHELAARRGEALTFDESYAMALSHPRHAELRTVMEQRKEAQAAQTAAANMAKVQRAGSSIRSSPVAAVRSGAPSSLRESLAANFDAVMGGR